jgi:hypothetical protein
VSFFDTFHGPDMMDIHHPMYVKHVIETTEQPPKPGPPENHAVYFGMTYGYAGPASKLSLRRVKLDQWIQTIAVIVGMIVVIGGLSVLFRSL